VFGTEVGVDADNNNDVPTKCVGGEGGREKDKEGTCKGLKGAVGAGSSVDEAEAGAVESDRGAGVELDNEPLCVVTPVSVVVVEIDGTDFVNETLPGADAEDVKVFVGDGGGVRKKLSSYACLTLGSDVLVLMPRKLGSVPTD
jgi:hypothetical protein